MKPISFSKRFAKRFDGKVPWSNKRVKRPVTTAVVSVTRRFRDTPDE